jgi:ferritin-like metal-binding protein YciE
MLKYGEESVLEAGIIVAAQKGEHYEMALAC